MRERMLFLGIGQGGSNIISLLDKKKYLSFYLNTSNEDLELINSKFKYHVPGARGCNKNREKALGYAHDYYEEMTSTIENHFPSQDIVYLVFTLGGGTGSGLGPILLDMLSMKNPNKKYNAIVVLPSLKESLQTRVNAIESFRELSEIEDLNSLFVLDNNYDKDRLKINHEFTKLFESVLNITRPDERGMIDNAELELLLTTKGATILRQSNKIYEGKLDTSSLRFNYDFGSSIFAKSEKGCKYIGISTQDFNEEKQIEELEKLYGKPIDTFVGYDDDQTTTIITGMNYPSKAIDELIASVEKDKEAIIDRVEPGNIKVPTLGERAEEEKKEKKDIDMDSLFKKYTR